MPLLTADVDSMQQLCDHLGKAYKDFANLADLSRTNSNTPSARVALNNAASVALGSVYDLSEDVAYDQTYALSNAIRKCRKDIEGTTTIASLISICNALNTFVQSNESVSFKTFYNTSEPLDNISSYPSVGDTGNTSVSFSADFVELWRKARSEFLPAKITQATSNGSAWTFSPTLPLTFTALTTFNIRVSKLGANSKIKITGLNSAGISTVITTDVSTKVSGGNDVVVSTGTTQLKSITAIGVFATDGTTAYNGANTDSFSIWYA